jgi:hypothetical protein
MKVGEMGWKRDRAALYSSLAVVEGSLLAVS